MTYFAKAAVAVFLTTFSLTMPALAQPCHHCPPEPTIGGEPQPTDDVLMGNGVNYAEARAANDKAIMEYDGWDPAVRAAQFIIWLAHLTGPNIPGAQSLQEQAAAEASETTEVLVLAQGKDDLFGEHRLVVPVAKAGMIKNGQMAYVETGRTRIPLSVSLPAASTKGYGGYLVMTGYDPKGEVVRFAIPTGKNDLEWTYPVVRVSGKMPQVETAKLYSEDGRGVKRK